jgi:TRAP-type mannitol/chloroaromatic compound transport system permease small subunit
MLQERIISSPWMPYIWPLKLAIPIGTFLLLLQGISELIKCLYGAYSGFDIHDKVEAVET